MRLINGRRLYPVQFHDCEVVKKGLDTVNEIRVVSKGNSATVFVNGKDQTTFKGHPTSSQNMIGLYGDSGAEKAYTWKFWDLLVRKPTP